MSAGERELFVSDECDDEYVLVDRDKPLDGHIKLVEVSTSADIANPAVKVIRTVYPKYSVEEADSVHKTQGCDAVTREAYLCAVLQLPTGFSSDQLELVPPPIDTTDLADNHVSIVWETPLGTPGSYAKYCVTIRDADRHPNLKCKITFKSKSP